MSDRSNVQIIGRREDVIAAGFIGELGEPEQEFESTNWPGAEGFEWYDVSADTDSLARAYIAEHPEAAFRIAWEGCSGVWNAFVTVYANGEAMETLSDDSGFPVLSFDEATGLIADRDREAAERYSALYRAALAAWAALRVDPKAWAAAVEAGTARG